MGGAIDGELKDACWMAIRLELVVVTAAHVSSAEADHVAALDNIVDALGAGRDRAHVNELAEVADVELRLAVAVDLAVDGARSSSTGGGLVGSRRSVDWRSGGLLNRRRRGGNRSGSGSRLVALNGQLDLGLLLDQWRSEAVAGSGDRSRSGRGSSGGLLSGSEDVWDLVLVVADSTLLGPAGIRSGCLGGGTWISGGLAGSLGFGVSGTLLLVSRLGEDDVEAGGGAAAIADVGLENLWAAVELRKIASGRVLDENRSTAHVHFPIADLVEPSPRKHTLALWHILRKEEALGVVRSLGATRNVLIAGLDGAGTLERLDDAELGVLVRGEVGSDRDLARASTVDGTTLKAELVGGTGSHDFGRGLVVDHELSTNGAWVV